MHIIVLADLGSRGPNNQLFLLKSTACCHFHAAWRRFAEEHAVATAEHKCGRFKISPASAFEPCAFHLVSMKKKHLQSQIVFLTLVYLGLLKYEYSFVTSYNKYN